MAISNNEIKMLRSLSSKKFRDQLGLFTVEGEKMVSEALKSSFEVRKVYRQDEIGEESMSKISMFSTPSPVLAIVRKPECSSLSEIGPKGLYLALDGIRDPGNMGTILRIADWFGIDGVFASDDSVELFNPKTVQSTMGAIFRVRFQYADIPALSRKLKSMGGKVYGTFLDGDNIYGKTLDTGSQSPAMIVVGNEANGISPEVAAEVSDRLFIPPYPPDDSGSESLNAAVATAVTVAEFRRRRYV